MKTLPENRINADSSCPAISLGFADENSPNRRLLESFVARKFAASYSAQLQQFLPYLLSLQLTHKTGAIVGIRPAREGRLFVEQYFAPPVEQAISRLFRTPVDRQQIVEVGNLAAAVPGSANLLFGALASILERAGFRWVVCTVTPQVGSLLASMQFPARVIGRALPTAVGKSATDWGNYYASKPRVIVGDVRMATSRLANDRRWSVISRQLRQPISSIAAGLKTATR